MKTTCLTLRRDDFQELSDGSSIFDNIIRAVGFNSAHDEGKIAEIVIDVPEDIGYRFYNEDGIHLLRINDPNTGLTRLEEFPG